MNATSKILAACGRVLRAAAPRVPLALRKRAAVLVGRLPGEHAKDLLVLALLDDWGARDPQAYHRFVWSHHLLFAKYYDFREFEQSRGRYFDALDAFRLEILETTAACVRDGAGGREVRSVLDVGCSMGYLLRHVETAIFPGAQRLLGIDIDAHAIAEGAAFLRRSGSRVELQVADLDSLDANGERFDVVLCTGVLHYLDEDEAARAVATMLRIAGGLVVISGPACETMDNAQLERSQPRAFYRDDLSMLHNFDRMVTAAGGHVVARRWGGGEINQHRRGAYFVVAAPAGG